MPIFSLSSELNVPPEKFWAHMSMAAVNAELFPLVRMSCPPAWRRCELNQWATGRVLFRSIIFLCGVLPVDLHALCLARMAPGQGFLERSHSLINQVWQHERTTVATARGCIVTDVVEVQGRLPWLSVCLLPIYRWVFRHRHRRLRDLYGDGRAQIGG